MQMSKPKLAIVIGSVRPIVSRGAADDRADRNGKRTVRRPGVDLKNYPMPIFANVVGIRPVERRSRGAMAEEDGRVRRLHLYGSRIQPGTDGGPEECTGLPTRNGATSRSHGYGGVAAAASTVAAECYRIADGPTRTQSTYCFGLSRRRQRGKKLGDFDTNQNIGTCCNSCSGGQRVKDRTRERTRTRSVSALAER